MNNNGVVIGYTGVWTMVPFAVMDFIYYQNSFVYRGGKTYDLNALVEVNWIMTNVGHINDAGQIAATGYPKGSNVSYALLLSPAGSSVLR
jgi:hypothetical protein